MAAIAAVFSFMVDECVIISPTLLFDEWLTDLHCSCLSHSLILPNQSFSFPLLEKETKLTNLSIRYPLNSHQNRKWFGSKVNLQSRQRDLSLFFTVFQIFHTEKYRLLYSRHKRHIRHVSFNNLKLQGNQSPFSISSLQVPLPTPTSGQLALCFNPHWTCCLKNKMLIESEP